MRNSTKTKRKYYRFLICEINSTELNTIHRDLYKFLQVYQSDLLAKVTDLYDDVFDENKSKYCLDGKLSKTLTRHAMNAYKYKRSISDIIDKIKFDWGASISRVSESENPDFCHESTNPQKFTITYPIFRDVVIGSRNYARISRWDQLILYFDRNNLPPEFRPLSKVHFHHQNNRLRIYTVGSYA